MVDLLRPVAAWTAENGKNVSVSVELVMTASASMFRECPGVFVQTPSYTPLMNIELAKCVESAKVL